MILGICTPYRHCEITAAAIRLAEVAISMSVTVRILASGQADRGVHPSWDGKVHSTRDDGAYAWARGCDYLAWFSHEPGLVRRGGLVAERAVNCLVLPWHNLPITDGEHSVFEHYGRIVCPAHCIYTTAVEKIFEDTHPSLTWCPWTSGIIPVKRSGLVGDKLRLYVPMDGSTMDETGLFVVRVVTDLLVRHPHLEVTLDCAKSWPKQPRNELKDLVQAWGTRLRVIYRTNLVDQISEMHSHDWMYLPAIRSNFGLMASRALACHLPVICLDVEPYSELVRSGVNGLLIPCELGFNHMHAPAAEPKLVPVVNRLSEALGDRSMAARLRNNNWRRSDDSQMLLFWRKEWQLN